jgi:predicted kinase
VAKLIITRGLPGSGKTTWARAQRWGVRVNRDDLRRMMHGGHTGEGWAEKQVTLAHRAQIEALLRAGTTVICDDTNLMRRSVKELAELAVGLGARVTVEDFTGVPVEVCIERDAKRPEDEQVGEEVIRRMHKKYLAGNRPPIELPTGAKVEKYEPSMDLPPAILVDLDGTMAIIGRRSPYDGSRVHLDAPNTPVVEAVRAMHASGHTIIFCTGRSDEFRHLTERWLAEHAGIPYEGLYMRRAGDMRRDAAVKREIFETEIRRHWRVVAVFDDRNQVVRMWRDLGLTVFQVAEGDF